MMKTKKKPDQINAMNFGSALAKLYRWHQESDIECLQVLLATHGLKDDDGYAVMADVRTQVGVAADRFTRCMRLLQGFKKSKPILSNDASDRTALLQEAVYNDSPSVKRIGLTSQGSEIVETVIGPLTAADETISQKNAEIEGFRWLVKTTEALGIHCDNDDIFTDPMTGVHIWRGLRIIKALIRDVSTMRDTDFDVLLDPRLKQVSKEILNGAKELDHVQKQQLDFSMFCVEKILNE